MFKNVNFVFSLDYSEPARRHLDILQKLYYIPGNTYGSHGWSDVEQILL